MNWLYDPHREKAVAKSKYSGLNGRKSSSWNFVVGLH